MSTITLTPGRTNIADIKAILDNPNLIIKLDRNFKPAVDKSAAVIKAVVNADSAVYGVNTGFGKLANVRIAKSDTIVLQRNLILSHCAGVGDLTDENCVRIMMVLKLLSLGRGASGVRWKLIEAIEHFLNHGLTPAIPQQGSVGASGDLAPLAHFAAALMGEGKVFYQGTYQNADIAIASAGLTPISLIAKEGLALINGTQFSTAVSLVSLFQAWLLANTAILSSSLTTDAIMGSTAPLQPAIHALRGHQGQIEVAACMRELLHGSQIRESHRKGDTRVQDPYCIRCQPQVTGACMELLRQAAKVLEVEANAVTDNPLVIVGDQQLEFYESGNDTANDFEDYIYSGGNFHAEPVSFAADQIAIALAEIGAIAQRRIALMVDPTLSFDLPPFLTPDPGLCSGFMVAEITSAALMSENKHLANPCSTDSTPTSANQEDHVSMAAHGAIRLQRMNKNLNHILAIELLCAARGVEFRAPLQTSNSLQSVLVKIREIVPTLQQDRYLATDIENTVNLIAQDLATSSAISTEMPRLQQDT